MPDEINLDNNNSEINLNLKIPPEDSDGSFSFRDLVLTVYNDRKIFLICICIGVVMGVAATAGVYFWRGSGTPVVVTSEVSVSVVLNYSNPSEHIFPDGSDFDIASFYTVELWENALNTVGRDDITVADAMSQVSITNIGYMTIINELSDVMGEIPENVPGAVLPTIANNLITEALRNGVEGNTYLITIPAECVIFENAKEKTDFLFAYCDEYSKYITSRFYNDDRIGTLQGQYLSDFRNMVNEEPAWDTFDYNVNFRIISNRYTAMLEMLDSLADEDRSYVSDEGKLFSEYAMGLREVINGDLAQWISRTNSQVYIRNINRFENEYASEIIMKKANYQYYLDLQNSYNDLLYSYRQSLATGEKAIMPTEFEETFNLFILSQGMAETVAELHRDISRLECMYEMLINADDDDSEIRSRSRDAEAALAGFITDLDAAQTALYNTVYEYYRQVAARDAENAVLVSAPNTVSVSTGDGSSSTILMAGVFVVCVAFGAVMAFLVVAVKKHLPEVTKIEK